MIMVFCKPNTILSAALAKDTAESIPFFIVSPCHNGATDKTDISNFFMISPQEYYFYAKLIENIIFYVECRSLSIAYQINVYFLNPLLHRENKVISRFCFQVESLYKNKIAIFNVIEYLMVKHIFKNKL